MNHLERRGSVLYICREDACVECEKVIPYILRGKVLLLFKEKEKCGSEVKKVEYKVKMHAQKQGRLVQCMSFCQMRSRLKNCKIETINIQYKSVF